SITVSSAAAAPRGLFPHPPGAGQRRGAVWLCQPGDAPGSALPTPPPDLPQPCPLSAEQQRPFLQRPRSADRPECATEHESETISVRSLPRFAVAEWAGLDWPI